MKRLPRLLFTASLTVVMMTATTITADFSGPTLDPNFVYTTQGGPFALDINSGHATITEGSPDQTTTLAFISTNFIVDGDFTAILSGDFSGIQDAPGHPISNIAGDQEIVAFEANFDNGGVANVFGRADENGFFLGDSIDSSDQEGILTGGGHTTQAFKITRIGSTVTVSTLDGLPSDPGAAYVDRQTISNADLTGAVSLEFYFENGNSNPNGGSVNLLSFSVTDDTIDTTTPEPASVLLALLGCITVVFIARRRAARICLAGLPTISCKI